MWIAILGACGTGKHSVVQMLERDGYTLLKENTPTIQEPGFDLEFAYACERLRIQIEAQKLMNKKDIITVHTFWETMDIFTPIAVSKFQLDETEVSRLKLMSETFKEILEPPHAVIYTQSEKMNAFNRMALRAQKIDQADFNQQIELYKSFVEKVRVPVVDIDGNRTFEDMKKDLEFGVASLKASTVGSQSFWARSMFR